MKGRVTEPVEEVAQLPVDESSICEIPPFILTGFPTKYPGLPDFAVDGFVDVMTTVTVIYVLKATDIVEIEGVLCKVYKPLLYPSILVRIKPERIPLQLLPETAEADTV